MSDKITDKQREPAGKPTFEELALELALEQDLSQQLRVRNFELLKENETLKKQLALFPDKAAFPQLCQICEEGDPTNCGVKGHSGYIKPDGTCFWFRLPITTG